MKEEIKAMLSSFQEDVTKFVIKIGLPFPGPFPRRLTEQRKKFKADFLDEELNEFRDARSLADETDALVDLIYVAIGCLIEMGIPPRVAWAEVQDKNMQKMRGEKSTRPGSEGNDAIKPEGWTPPDHEAILRELLLRSQVSPGLMESTLIRLKRSAKYNQGAVQLRDHFPLGPASYFQMIWTKAIRLRSMMESPDGRDEKAIWDTLRDLNNYNSFWMEDSAAWTEGQRWGSE